MRTWGSAALVVIAACGRGTPEPSPPPTGAPSTAVGAAPVVPAIDVPVRIDGQPATVLAAAATPIDLWSLCTRYPSAKVIVARSAAGTYAQGSCDQRATYALTLDNVAGVATARLASTFDGKRSVIATAEHVVAIELVVAPAAAPSPAAGLTITIPGRPPTVLSAAQLDALTPVKHHQAGVPLTALLAAAKVDVPPGSHLIAVTDAERYDIGAAWLHDPEHTLMLKHNRQGLLRFDHVGPDGKRAHLRGVRTIELVPAKP